MIVDIFHPANKNNYRINHSGKIDFLSAIKLTEFIVAEVGLFYRL